VEVEVQFQTFLTSALHKGVSKTRVNTLYCRELYFDFDASVTAGMHQTSTLLPLTFKNLCHRGNKFVSSVCSWEVTLLQVEVYCKLLASHTLKDGSHCAQDRDCTESVSGAPDNRVVRSCKSGWQYGDQ
jgi:hypothetical protein